MSHCLMKGKLLTQEKPICTSSRSTKKSAPDVGSAWIFAPRKSSRLKDEKSEVANIDECLGCESCVETCPESAITLTET